jgi:hypothetical protein
VRPTCGSGWPWGPARQRLSAGSAGVSWVRLAFLQPGF